MILWKTFIIVSTNHAESQTVKMKLMKACIIFIVLSFFAYGVYWMFFDIQRIEGQDKIVEVLSPSNEYTVTAYLNSGGATTGWSVLGSVTYNETGKTKNIYWKYECEEADIYWVDEKTVSINGEKLNVSTDIYDYRRE